MNKISDKLLAESMALDSERRANEALFLAAALRHDEPGMDRLRLEGETILRATFDNAERVAVETLRVMRGGR